MKHMNCAYGMAGFRSVKLRLVSTMFAMAQFVVPVAFLSIVHVESARAQSTPPQNCRDAWLPADAPAICPFTTAPKLPSARTYHASAATKSMIYVAGGYVFDGTAVRYLDDVLYTNIHADGTLDAWTRASQPFTQGRSGLGLAVVGKCLFLAGGSWYANNAAKYGGDLQWTELDARGQPTAWHKSPNELNTPRSNASLIAYTGPNGTFLYMVAGVTERGTDVVHLDEIEYTKVNADCSIAPWKTAAYHLHGGRSSPQAVLLGDQITVVGGWGDLDLVDVYRDVLITRIRTDGSLEPWRRSSTSLPTGMYGHASVLSDASSGPRMLLAVGGQPGTGAYANWLAYAYALPGVPMTNVITSWSIAPTGRLPSARAGHSAHLVGGFLYVIGGNTATGGYLDEVLQTRVTPGTP